MKVEFEFNIDGNGMPCIKFKHHDNSKELEQNLLEVFIYEAKKKGLVIENTGGYIDTVENSYKKYEIKIKK
jgi:hypothetical protein